MATHSYKDALCFECIQYNTGNANVTGCTISNSAGYSFFHILEMPDGTYVGGGTSTQITISLHEKVYIFGNCNVSMENKWNVSNGVVNISGDIHSLFSWNGTTNLSATFDDDTTGPSEINFTELPIYDASDLRIDNNNGCLIDLLEGCHYLVLGPDLGGMCEVGDRGGLGSSTYNDCYNLQHIGDRKICFMGSTDMFDYTFHNCFSLISLPLIYCTDSGYTISNFASNCCRLRNLTIENYDSNNGPSCWPSSSMYRLNCMANDDTASNVMIQGTSIHNYAKCFNEMSSDASKGIGFALENGGIFSRTQVEHCLTEAHQPNDPEDSTSEDIITVNLTPSTTWTGETQGYNFLVGELIEY